VSQDRLGHAAEIQPAEAAASMRGHSNQVGVERARLLDDRLGGAAGDFAVARGDSLLAQPTYERTQVGKDCLCFVFIARRRNRRPGRR